MAEKEPSIVDILGKILGEEQTAIPNTFDQRILDEDRQAIYNHHLRDEGTLNEELMDQYNIMLQMGIFDDDKTYFEKRDAKDDAASLAESDHFIWPDEQDELGGHLKAQEDMLTNMHLESVDPVGPSVAPLPLFDGITQSNRVDSGDVSTQNQTERGSPTVVRVSSRPDSISSDDNATIADTRSSTPQTDTPARSIPSSDTVYYDQRSSIPPVDAGASINDSSPDTVQNDPSMAAIPLTASATSPSHHVLVASPSSQAPLPTIAYTNTATLGQSQLPPPLDYSSLTINGRSVPQTVYRRAQYLLACIAHHLLTTNALSIDEHANLRQLRNMLANEARRANLSDDQRRFVGVASAGVHVRAREGKGMSLEDCERMARFWRARVGPR